ncbi:MAG: 50S ribosomal protein L13 [Candidatus Hecatellaceae archaeon]
MAEAKPTVIDANGLIAGRLASVVAKRLLKGETIIVVNAERAVLSGRKHSRVREVKEFLEVVGRANPIRGPRHPRSPDRFLREMVWGMLPRDRPRGREAYRRLKVYVGVPSELGEVGFESIPEASAEKLKRGYVTLGEVCRELGWRPRGVG